MSQIAQYRGKELTYEHQKWLRMLEDRGFEIAVTGPSSKTIRIKKGDRNFGYINSTVLCSNYQGIFGYRFEDDFGGNDACPHALMGRIDDLFSAHYGVSSGWVCHQGSGNNRDRKFLIITDWDLANRVLGIS